MNPSVISNRSIIGIKGYPMYNRVYRLHTMHGSVKLDFSEGKKHAEDKEGRVVVVVRFDGIRDFRFQFHLHETSAIRIFLVRHAGDPVRIGFPDS
jgi:hypothetical protein